MVGATAMIGFGVSFAIVYIKKRDSRELLKSKGGIIPGISSGQAIEYRKMRIE